MTLYKTSTGNTYTFDNGRVSCSAHNLDRDLVFGTVRIGAYGCLYFRTVHGTWRTSPVTKMAVPK